ncbi:uncharacterized protein [Venturia canescens]|uniref:uncharacterized protein n=1 Tax=Venturia canescens TaxID=32260 RepID=UPI001C9C8C2A|nr:uncharacterized protein LOC122406961 [Venturia canescens]XP_043268768.1 uncharacterized protein LOC122406961 [Venturia canescens]XP_043268769.1 uncharacterized protein LOC122406961 [Venturia canescens]
MPTELDSSVEVNSTYSHGFPGSPGAVVVRAEEALIVIFVLILWVAAIALFFNRWGKIRMLEPYQPKFQQQHRPSCAVADTTSLPLRTCSKFNIQCLEHPLHQSIQMGQRPRQNSVFVGSSVSLLANDQSTPRRAKSAFDLQSLVLAECTVQNNNQSNDVRMEGKVNEEDAIDETEPEYLPFTLAHSSSNRRLKPFNEYPKPSRSFQRERGASMCHFDRTDVIARPLQRERGMSICQFDRMDVLARPLQPRDRGSSICHFDRMDVLARPSCYRGSRSSIAGNVDKLENLGKSFQRDSRTSIIFNSSIDKSQIGGLENIQRFANANRPRDPRTNFPILDRPENMSRFLQRNSRASLGNSERPGISENLGRNELAGQSVGNIGTASPRDHRTGNLSPYDRPSCSKTPDVVLGYEATCV